MGNKMESSIFVSDPIKGVFLKVTGGFIWPILYTKKVIYFNMHVELKHHAL